MEYWIWLTGLKGIGPIMQKRLLDYFNAPYFIYKASKEELLSVPGIGDTLAQGILANRSLDLAFNIIEKTNQMGIKILNYNDELYSNFAKEMTSAPTILYYKGHLKEKITGVGIVGARRCTSYGKQIAIEAAEYLAMHGVTVISGLAKGIDGYAHTASLKAGGYTLAFLGNGVDISYPKEHAELMEGIIEKGAVISEYPPGTMARSEHFPRRNSLISSWSQKVLIVEGAEKSGALITAQFAKSQGRQVYVPPHEIHSTTGKGTNRLLTEGAILYLEPSQLILGIGSEDNNSLINNKQVEINMKSLSLIEEKILESLKGSAKTVEEIGNVTSIDLAKLIENLTIMELEGLIRSLAGGKFKIS